MLRVKTVNRFLSSYIILYSYIIMSEVKLMVGKNVITTATIAIYVRINQLKKLNAIFYHKSITN